MKGTRWAGRILPALAAAALLAGCGTVEEEGRQDEDAAIAREALLTQRDVPAELVVAPGGEDEEELDEAELRRMCPGYPADELRLRTDADRSFESDSAIVTHGVVLMDGAGKASEMVADTPSPRSRRCMRNMVFDGMREIEEMGFRRGRVAVAPIDVAAPPGSAALRVAIPLAGDGAQQQDLEIEAEMVLTARGRGVTMVMVMGMMEPVDAELRDRLAARAAERLSSALEAE